MKTTQYRVFEQDAGWSEWQAGPTAGDASDIACPAWLQAARPDLTGQRPADDGMSLSKVRADGSYAEAGLCVIAHDRGIAIVEFRTV